MKLKLLITVSVLGLALVFGLSYFSSKGKVYIDLGNVPANADLTLNIDQDNDEDIRKVVKNKTSVTLPSGTYTLSLYSGTNNLVSVVTVPSFFGTTTISGNLENEQKRTFVGTNPSPCMLYVVNTFYSMACGDDTNALQQQVVPTLSTPGYTVTPESDVVGVVLGTSATNTATYTLLENYTDEGTIQDLVKVGGNLSAAKVIEIPASSAQDLTITASGNRVLVYSAANTVGYMYDESTGSLQKVTLPKPDTGFELVDVSISNTFVVTTYSKSEEGDGVEGEKITGESKLYVQDLSGKTTKYETSSLYSKSTYCNPSTLCAVGVEGLDILEIQGTKLKKVTALPGVNDMFSYGDTVRFIDKTGIQIFNSATLKGHYEYTFGGYTPCGASTSVGGYLVCLIDKKNQKHALFVSTTEKAGSDDIDKKVLDLLKRTVVYGVSAVNNYIYVIPNYGDVDIFTQDSETTARVNQAINNVISKSTIPKQQYFVINAGAPL